MTGVGTENRLIKEIAMKLSGNDLVTYGTAIISCSNTQRISRLIIVFEDRKVAK
jgi:hypothetical protein